MIPFSFKEFLDRCGKIRARPKIVCADGFKMSVQGNELTYSIPRKCGTEFQAMEVGFPSEPEPLLMEFAEDPAKPTTTVYCYVPVDVIKEIVAKHGFIDSEKTFESF